MVRPHFGPSSCFKTRPHSDEYNNNNNMSHEEHYSRSQRGFRGQPGKGPWRDTRGRGRSQFIKRSPLMGERREQPFGQWSSPNQNSFHAYPSAKEPYHGNRKPSPSRPNVPPPTQPRSSPMSPARTSPGERGPPFHAHHSAHRNVSPRHYHGPPPDRRPMPAPPLHRGSFRGVHRGPNPSREDARTWGGPWRNPSPMENAQADGEGKRWNRRGGFANSYNGERGPPGPDQRKPRDLYTRGLYPERSSAERDPRKQHGEMGREMEGNAHCSGEWQQGRGSFHQPLYRSPSWKGGQAHSSFYHNSPQERPEGSLPQRKRFFPEHYNDGEHDQPKHARRDAPPFFNNGPRAFGGKPMSLRDKSRIVKGRKMRAESVLRLKAPPPQTRAEEPKTAPKACPQEEGTRRATLAMRKERFQENAEPLRKRPNKTRQSPPNSDGNSSQSSRDSESAKEQVESRQALRAHSSSPIDRLPKDLVIVSQWQAEPNSSSDEGSSSRERTCKTKTERHFTSEGQPKQKEHSSKIHVFHTSPKNHRGRYFDNQRQENMQEENHRPGRSFRESGPPQRPGFYPGPKRTFSDPAGQFRKPLMGAFVPRQFPNQKPVPRPFPNQKPVPRPFPNQKPVPRPFPNQKPVFRKSQSIMSKYRNLQTFRQKVPQQREANHRRW